MTAATEAADPRAEHRVPLTVLVVGWHAWSLEETTRRLVEAGHRALRCQGMRDRLPCRMLRGEPGCPLDERPDVVVVVRPHPLPVLEAGEVGAICAIREGVPLVVAGHTLFHPFDEVAAAVLVPGDDVAGSDDLLAAVEEAASQAKRA